MTTLAVKGQMDFTDGNGRSIAPALAPHPLAILNNAVERGANIETLERISALAREWKADAARQQYAEAMATVQKDLPVIVAKTENKHTKSKYAKLETVQKAIKDKYLANGFTVTFSEEGPPVDGMIHVVGVVRHVGGHQEAFHRWAPADTAGPEGKVNKTMLQGSQSTVSYISRRLLCEIFGVTVQGDDEDGNAKKTPLSKDQLANLHALLKEINYHEGDNLKKFLSFAQVASLSEIMQSDYQRCVDSLLRKKAKAA